MSFQRKLIREQLKKLNNDNDIKKNWLNYQLGKQSVQEYLNMRNKNKRKRK